MIWALSGMIWVFGFAVVLIVIWHLRSKRRIERLRMVHEERMRAMEKGVPMPELPEIDAVSVASLIDSVRINPKWPLGLGAIFIFAGLGIIPAFMLAGEPEVERLWSLGFIGVFVGIGLMLYYFLTRTAKG